MTTTKIEWTDKVWNPITGCSKVSEGCRNCYAEAMFKRFEKKWGKFTDVILHPERLEEPLRLKKPSKIFVNSMSDLFHEKVPFDFIAHVFSTMRNCPKHTFQILTKRPERMKIFMNLLKSGFPSIISNNIWLGISVENQATADERIPILLQIPVTKRFVSCEPLLGKINLGNFINKLDWVIVGGETGYNARPCHSDWVSSIQQQCEQANVPFFFKQWGEWAPVYYTDMNGNTIIKAVNNKKEIVLNHVNMVKVGKKNAGRELDGIEYNHLPK